MQKTEGTILTGQFFINIETGETRSTEPKLLKQKRIIDPIEKPVTYLERADVRHFSSIRVDPFRSLISKLSVTNLGYLLLLSSYQRYNTGILYADDYQKKPITLDDVPEIINKSELTAQRVINDLLEKSALIQIELSYNKKKYIGYKVSDEFFFKGVSKSKETSLQSIKQYIEEIREVFSENGAAATGWLSKLLPFIDKQTNFICFNPNREFQYEDLDTMTRADIELVTDTVKRDVSKRIREMKIHEYKVFAEIVTGGRFRKIKLNPLIYNRMSGDVRDTVLKDFTTR